MGTFFSRLSSKSSSMGSVSSSRGRFTSGFLGDVCSFLGEVKYGLVGDMGRSGVVVVGTALFCCAFATACDARFIGLGLEGDVTGTGCVNGCSTCRRVRLNFRILFTTERVRPREQEERYHRQHQESIQCCPISLHLKREPACGETPIYPRS